MARSRFKIPINTDRSRLTSCLLYGFLSMSSQARNRPRPVGIRGYNARQLANQSER